MPKEGGTMKIEKPWAVMIVVVVVVLVASFSAAMLKPSWLGTIIACVVGVILGQFLRSKGFVK
jgi:hypothetical protein